MVVSAKLHGGYAYVYGVNSGGAVYSRPIDGSKAWRRIPSIAMRIFIIVDLSP